MVAGRLFEDGAVFREHRVVWLVRLGSSVQVYEVSNVRTERRYALKCRDARRAPPEDVERFQLALKRLIALRHENVPPVFDGGIDGGVLWLLEEFVEGPSVLERPAKWIPTFSWSIQVVQALDVAAEEGLFHGDLSPESLIEIGGSVRILGLGVRALFGAAAADVKRSRRFQAPELRAGHAADAQSDMYSLGLVMHAALTGERVPPRDPPFLNGVNGCPLAMAQIVARCIERDRSKRWPSWSHVESNLLLVATHLITGGRLKVGQVPSSSGPSSDMRVATIKREGDSSSEGGPASAASQSEEEGDGEGSSAPEIPQSGDEGRGESSSAPEAPQSGESVPVFVNEPGALPPASAANDKGAPRVGEASALVSAPMPVPMVVEPWSPPTPRVVNDAHRGPSAPAPRVEQRSAPPSSLSWVNVKRRLRRLEASVAGLALVLVVALLCGPNVAPLRLSPLPLPDAILITFDAPEPEAPPPPPRKKALAAPSPRRSTEPPPTVTQETEPPPAASASAKVEPMFRGGCKAWRRCGDDPL